MEGEIKTFEVTVTMQATQFVEAKTKEEANEIADKEELMNQVRNWSCGSWSVKEL